MKSCFIIPVLTILIITLSVIPSYAGHKREKSILEAKLKEVIYENFTAAQKENLEALKQTIHSQSPVYIASTQTVKQLFDRGEQRFKEENLYAFC